MTTLADVLTSAGKALKYIGRTQTMSAQDANDASAAFNSMLDSWTTEQLLSFVVLERSFTLIVGQASYTIGTSGTPDINATRPTDIVQAYVQDTTFNNFLMNIKTRDWWNQIGNRGSTITSQIPTDLFYDPQYPNGVINIFPTPLLAYTVFYDSTQNQVDPSALTQTITMPPGYIRAYVLNTALEMMAYGFPCLLDDKELANLRATAAEAKGNIKRMNIKDVIANYDASIVSRSYATYNIYRDTSN